MILLDDCRKGYECWGCAGNFNWVAFGHVLQCEVTIYDFLG
jgi:hypothetical protein